MLKPLYIGIGCATNLAYKAFSNHYKIRDNKGGVTNLSSIISNIESRKGLSANTVCLKLPFSTLPCVDGSSFQFSSPFFGGYAQYNPYYQGKIYPEPKIDYEILEVMGLKWLHLEAIKLGATIGGLVSGIVTTALAATTFGVALGVVGLLVSIGFLVWDLLEKQKEETRKRNLILAQSVGMSHTMLVDCAKNFINTGIIILPSVKRKSIISALEKFKIHHHIERWSKTDDRLLEWPKDFMPCYEAFHSLIGKIRQINMLEQPLDERLDLKQLGLSEEMFYEVVDEVHPARMKKSHLKFISDLVDWNTYGLQDGVLLKEDEGVKHYVLNNTGTYTFKAKQKQTVRIAPQIPFLSTAFLRSEVMSADYEQEVIKSITKPVDAKARLWIKGVQGITLLKPAIHLRQTRGYKNVIHMKENEVKTIAIPDDISGFAYNYTFNGRRIKIPYVLSTRGELSVEHTPHVKRNSSYVPRLYDLLDIKHFISGRRVINYLHGLFPTDWRLPDSRFMSLVINILHPAYVFGLFYNIYRGTLILGFVPRSGREVKRGDLVSLSQQDSNVSQSPFRVDFHHLVKSVNLDLSEYTVRELVHLSKVPEYEVLWKALTDPYIIPSEVMAKIKHILPYYEFGELVKSEGQRKIVKYKTLEWVVENVFPPRNLEMIEDVHKYGYSEKSLNDREPTIYGLLHSKSPSKLEIKFYASKDN